MRVPAAPLKPPFPIARVVGDDAVVLQPGLEFFEVAERVEVRLDAFDVGPHLGDVGAQTPHHRPRRAAPAKFRAHVERERGFQRDEFKFEFVDLAIEKPVVLFDPVLAQIV